MFRIARCACVLLLLPIAMLAAGANAFVRHDLISDTPGVAAVTDPNLVNPWGIALSATSPFWVSNTGSGTATVYNGSGAILPLVVTIPAAASGAKGTPTGQVFNNTSSFLLANGNKASFIFSTEDGTISAWNGGSAASIQVNNSSSGAVYYGLAIGTNSAGGAQLYAPNFASGKIEIYSGTWAPTTASSGFADPAVPAGYAPFNIWPLAGKLYVAYAKQGPLSAVAGAGQGYVSVFDFDGNLVKHLISGAPLNAPWGMAIAPSTFGAFAGDLLVGNFGDGTINAFDPNTGASLGTLEDTSGNPLVFPGLWALVFGNGGTGGDRNTLYVTAGVGNLQHGLLSSIAPPATILSVVNGASFASGAVAPGEVITISGITIGPSPGATNAIPAVLGRVSTNLASMSVLFNYGNGGAALAPVLYASASQADVIVPYGLGGFSSANIVLNYGGRQLTMQVPVALSAPGIFTANASGSGQASALNPDGTVNSSTNPAPSGSIITLFATGQGPELPPGEDGVVNDRVLRVPQLPVTLTIGGQTADVLYAGTAPGLVQGVMQVEAVIPSGLTGAVPVVLTVGSAGSQANVTINVQ
ncbi:MAG TPA: TIGR03118 family protein [Bryobacteraceae bacterium]